MVDIITSPNVDTFMQSADKAAMMLNLNPRVEFLGDWTQQTYEDQQMVLDGTFLAVANTSTNDRPAPQPVGEAIWLMPESPSWANLSETDYLLTGMRIANLTGIYAISKMRVWIPDISPDVSYRLVVTNNLTGEVEAGLQLDGDAVSAPGWFTFVVDFVLLPGDDFTFEILSQNLAATTDFNHPWAYLGTSNQEVDPGTGNLNIRGNQAILRINTTDDDAISRSAQLASVTPGTVIRIADEGDPTAYYEYDVQTSTNNTTWFSYAVALLSTGSGGAPPLGRSTVSFQVPIPASTNYVQLTNHFLTTPEIDGVIQIGDASQTQNDNGYGLDIFLQQYEASSDWFLIPVGDSFSGSSGSDVFATLTHDTVKVVNPAAMTAVYANIGNLVTPDRPAGKYQIEFSVTYDFNIITDSAFFRFRVDGAAWNEFRKEPSDVTENVPFYYSYPGDYAAGSHTVELEARKQNGSGIMNVYFADTSFFRIG